eukprot:6198749-Pleurochrysis_carterae.AAC.1
MPRNVFFFLAFNVMRDNTAFQTLPPLRTKVFKERQHCLSNASAPQALSTSSGSVAASLCAWRLARATWSRAR